MINSPQATPFAQMCDYYALFGNVILGEIQPRSTVQIMQRTDPPPNFSMCGMSAITGVYSRSIFDRCWSDKTFHAVLLAAKRGPSLPCSSIQLPAKAFI